MVEDTHYFNNTCTDDGCATNNIRQGSYATKVTCSDGRSFTDFEADDASGTLFPNCDLVENSCDPAVECNVCDECCQDYITSKDSCDSCVTENCHVCKPSDFRGCLNVCDECCQDYIDDCDSCVAEQCN